jgi:hypothetical protein
MSLRRVHVLCSSLLSYEDDPTMHNRIHANEEAWANCLPGLLLSLFIHGSIHQGCFLEGENMQESCICWHYAGAESLVSHA